MTQSEQTILTWCRSFEGKRAVGGSPCMRGRPDGTKVVVDVERFDCAVVAKGADWDAVLVDLRGKGFAL